MDITTIVSAVVTLCMAILTVCVVPALKAKYGQEKVDEALAKAEQIAYWIKIFVAAAEQIYPALGSGKTRKQYVVDLVTAKLTELNIKVDADVINAQIEAAVLELHHELKGNEVITTEE